LPPDSKKARILIVDDEEDITSILKKGLEKYGYEIDVFNDPLLAFSSFKAGLYDLILLDIRMPKMDGFELSQQLQNIDGRVKICFMTAYEVYSEALKELFPESYSSICFIKKPFSVQDFVERIRREMVEDRSQ
jgi:DNA-binding response OmpR family regulator